MPEPLTSLERRILDYLIDYLRRNTYQPSIREIGRRFDIKSTKTVAEYLQSLADKGWIERDPSRSRGVRILGVDLNAETVSVPYFHDMDADGSLGEGSGPNEAFEVDRKLVGPCGSYFLRMSGSSMAGVGILDGDLLLVEPVDESEIRNGDIVVARVNGERVAKRLQTRGGERVLESADPSRPSIPLGPEWNAELTGRVSAVFRRFTAPDPLSVNPAPFEHAARDEVAR